MSIDFEDIGQAGPLPGGLLGPLGLALSALGLSPYLFGGSQPTFDEGWRDAAVFDQRLAALHGAWVALDRQIWTKCPYFYQKDAGANLRALKSDMASFGAFYKRAGQRSTTFADDPTAALIGQAQQELVTFVTWAKRVDAQCPGTFPGLASPLTPTAAELEAEKTRKKKAEDEQKDPLTEAAKSLGWILAGTAAVGVGLFWLANRAVQSPAGSAALRVYSRGTLGGLREDVIRTARQQGYSQAEAERQARILLSGQGWAKSAWEKGATKPRKHRKLKVW